MKYWYSISLFLVLFSCHSIKNPEAINRFQDQPFTELFSSTYQGREVESNVVVQNQDDLNILFKSVGIEKVPKVDFSKNQVVALFLGTKNTGGYQISVDKVVENSDTITVFKKIVSPNGSATMAFTNPFTIVEIHSKKQIVFE